MHRLLRRHPMGLVCIADQFEGGVVIPQHLVEVGTVLPQRVPPIHPLRAAQLHTTRGALLRLLMAPEDLQGLREWEELRERHANAPGCEAPPGCEEVDDGLHPTVADHDVGSVDNLAHDLWESLRIDLGAIPNRPDEEVNVAHRVNEGGEVSHTGLQHRHRELLGVHVHRCVAVLDGRLRVLLNCFEVRRSAVELSF